MTVRPAPEASTRKPDRPGLVACAISGLVAVLALGAVITLSTPFAWAVSAVNDAIFVQQQAVASNFAQNLAD